jgi:tetratricopeptide (TPR) repeat protein
MKNTVVPQPGVLSEKPTLSVCMIVCDEEKMLPTCLKSIQHLADELIVVDTGSKDGTISIAKDFGAKVFHFKWSDDFAAARNEYLKHATGDWIFQIDADEELLSRSVPHLKDRMLRSTVLCYFVRTDNGPKCTGPRFGWNARLFRNHPHIRYSRPYHEMVQASAEKLISKEPRWKREYEAGITILHHGYEPCEMPKKWKRGLRLMKAYLKENPNDAYILTKLGGTCCDLERYDEAEHYLKKALEISPDSSEANYALGLTWQKQNKLEAAIRCYEKAIADDSTLAEAMANLGAIFVEKGMLDEAISVQKRALAVNPELASAHRYLGLAYVNKGIYDEAIAALKKAIALNPDGASAHMNLAIAYTRKGMLDEGIAEYKLALTLTPEDAKAHTNLGVAYEKKGMLDDAIAQHKRAIRIDPGLTAGYINLGTAYYNKGMLEDAVTQYKRALQIDANDAEAYYNLAVAYYFKNQHELAVQQCDRAIELGFHVDAEFLRQLKENQ